jgi:hypothetical protein
LDISNNPALEDLDCAYNQLTSLDVSINTALTGLYCDNNQLTSLDVSINAALTRLYCDGNQLTSLDVSNNTALIRLYCDNNQLTSLDVSKNTALERLYCYINQITSLVVSDNIDLTELRCYDNQLTSLDVWNNTALDRLYCDNNQLTSLDVSNNLALTELRCEGNQLTSLDVSNNTALTRLDISEMPTLFEVCVWTMPFPPDGLILYTGSSPNVNFTTECTDYTAPRLFAADTLYQAEFIEVTCTEDGMIYLVPVDTDKDLTIIQGVSIDSVVAVADSAVNVSISGLENGIYWLYARDSTGNLSEPKGFTIMGVGIDNIIAEQIRIFPNPANNQITVQTNGTGIYSLVITSLNGQIIHSKNFTGSSHQIDLSTFQKGLYFITIKSRDYVRTEKIIKL